MDLHARRAHPSGLHASAARTKESDRCCSCSIDENFKGIHRSSYLDGSMYVDSTGALLPQETSDAQAAAVTANRISLMDFIKYIGGGLLEGNTYTALSNIENYSSRIFC